MCNAEKITRRLVAAVQAAACRVLDEHAALVDDSDISVSMNDQGDVSVQIIIKGIHEGE